MSTRIVAGMRAISGDDSGQAMVFLLVILGTVMAFAGGIYVTSTVAVEKIRAQNAADAAALAGAGILADSLDLLVYVNWIRFGSYMLAHWGQATRQLAEWLARLAIKQASLVANARAVQVGVSNGALVIPLHNPQLGARETGFFGIRYYKDTLSGRVGSRFVRVSASPLSGETQPPVSVPFFTGIQLPAVGLAEAVIQGRGLGRPKFRGGLGRLRALP